MQENEGGGSGREIGKLIERQEQILGVMDKLTDNCGDGDTGVHIRQIIRLNTLNMHVKYTSIKLFLNNKNHEYLYVWIMHLFFFSLLLSTF